MVKIVQKELLQVSCFEKIVGKEIMDMGIDRRGKKHMHCMVKEHDCTDYELPESVCEQPTKRNGIESESCCVDVDATGFEIVDWNNGESPVERDNSDGGDCIEESVAELQQPNVNEEEATSAGKIKGLAYL